MSGISNAVEKRLDHWGRVYRWTRESDEPNEKNVLYDWVKFQGPPPRGTCSEGAPDRDADEIEDIVMRLASTNAEAATCLRRRYCDRGTIYEKAGDIAMSAATFKTYVRLGEMYVAGALESKRKAA